MSDRALKDELADYSQRLHARGWVANHDGNVTARLGEGRYLATPTSTSKAEIGPEDIIVVDEGGAKVSGRGKPFGEIGLHLTVYRNRPDAKAVVHAHPPTATGFAVAGPEACAALGQPIIAEAVVSLGPSIPTVPFAAPGQAACQALQPFVLEHDVVLLGGHGVLAWGDSVEQAYLRCELVEHLAKIALVARQLGGARPLPQAVIPALLESRAKAGLGPRGRGASAPAPTVSAATASAPAQATSASGKKVVVACAPAPPGSDVTVYEKPKSTVKPNPSELADIIRQEIVRALKEK